MKAQFIQCDGRVDYTPSSAVAAGDVVVVSSRIGIATQAIAANALGSLAIEGIFDIQKCNDNIGDGVAVYWDADGNSVDGVAGTGAATTTSSGNTFMGYSVGAAGTTVGIVRVNLFGGLSPTVTIKGPTDTAIADPGNAGAIAVTTSGYCPIVTAGSETRTLAAPSFAGQQLLIYVKTDGGTCVITASAAVNQTGNNTLTLADVNDSILLVGIENGANKVWRVVCNDGVALTTV